MTGSSPKLRLIEGDAGASFRKLYADHQAFVWRTVQHLGLSKASADDATQEVFIVVHRRWHEYDPARPLRSWLWGICRLVVANLKRSDRRRERRLTLVDEGDSPLLPDDELRRDEALTFVRNFVAALRPKQRDVFVLCEIEGMSGPEVADALNLRVNTVYSRLRKARAQFESALQRRNAIQRREAGEGR